MTAALTAEFIRQRLADLPEVLPDLRLVVLFGSAARDGARSESDIDLAVQCDGPADLDTFYLAMAPRLGTDRLDLIDLRRAGPVLAMAVARTGHLLFEKEPGAFREFQSLASRRYCDTDKLRRARRRAIHAFLEREGLA
jgi:predicted nucleotidyltransferase